MKKSATPLNTLQILYTKEQNARKKYAEHYKNITSSQQYSNTVDDIIQNGYSIKNNVIDKEILKKILDQFENFLNQGVCISSPRKIPAINSLDDSQRLMEMPRLSNDELRKGFKTYRHIVDNVQMQDPLINCSEIVDLCLNVMFIEIAAKYLNSFPALAYVKLVRNFVNDLPLFDTQFFHMDTTAAKLLKVFIYLNDVDQDGGPLCYVKHSHHNINKYWDTKPRWNKDEINKEFGDKNLILCTAKKGDVIFADTTGFHKGVKPLKNDRNVLVITYSLHQDYTFNGKLDVLPKIKNSKFSSLSVEKRALLDLVEKI
jgi:hypothetical protein